MPFDQSKNPFRIIAFDLHVSEPSTGYRLSLQEQSKRYPIAKVLDDSAEGWQAMAQLFSYHGYLGQKGRDDYTKVKFEALPVFSPMGLASNIQYCLNARKLGTLDRDALMSYFGPALGVYLLQQETALHMMNVLTEKTKECLGVFGFVLPKHVTWADPAAKKKSR